MVVVSAPSGTGKTTIVKKLVSQHSKFVSSISYTTRAKRANEIDGVDYFFINQQLFIQMANKNMFIEHAKVFDYYYGTPKKEISQALEKGHTVFLEIDWQGAELIRKTDLGCVSIFIVPPSKQELKKRLTNRATDSMDQIAYRYKLAVKDIEQYINFDCVVVNKNIDLACHEIIEFLGSSQNIKNNISNEAMAIIKSFTEPQIENI
mgnify:CR=1 FL=1